MAQPTRQQLTARIIELEEADQRNWHHLQIMRDKLESTRRSAATYSAAAWAAENNLRRLRVSAHAAVEVLAGVSRILDQLTNAVNPEQEVGEDAALTADIDHIFAAAKDIPL